MRPRKDVVADPSLVAYCGLYCGACKSYLMGRCPGCRQKQNAAWCKVRSCCTTNCLETCADCGAYPDPPDCPILNNFVARLFRLVLNSNRCACVRQIKELGVEEHAIMMAHRRQQSMRR